MSVIVRVGSSEPRGEGMADLHGGEREQSGAPLNGERVWQGQGVPGGARRPQRIGPVPAHYSASRRLTWKRSILAACAVRVNLVILWARADGRTGWLGFLHCTLRSVKAFVGAELERVGPSRQFGVGVATAGVQFWRDPSGPRAPGDNGPGRGRRSRVGGLVGVPAGS